MAIRNPSTWTAEKIQGARYLDSATAEEYWPNAGKVSKISLRQLGFADLRYALRRGMEDFAAYRTDVVFLCVIYPVMGLVLARFALGGAMPLLFPLAAGFALVGPFAAVGLNEMSRRRELGLEPRWTHAFAVLRSPALPNVLLLGAILIGLFMFWMVLAQFIYDATLGPEAPVSAAQFVRDVLYTRAGWTMIMLGTGVGFLFALLVLTISVVSFPMLLDRNVSLEMAISTSVRAVASNPWMMIVWGLVITAGLVIGSIPALLGLVVVMPVLGHATWHWYRRVVNFEGPAR